MESNIGVSRFGRARIEICGGIGAGKTTVAQYLAKAWNLNFIREIYRQIPFWEKYYAMPSEYELEKNISFLLSHGDALRSGVRNANPQDIHISDFALFQILAYADLSRSPDDALAVEAVYERMLARFGTPRLLLHVHCPVEIQVERIRKRGRVPESNITEDYLRELSNRIVDRIGKFRDTVLVIDIDTSEIDFVNYPIEAMNFVQRMMPEDITPSWAALRDVGLALSGQTGKLKLGPKAG